MAFLTLFFFSHFPPFSRSLLFSYVRLLASCKLSCKYYNFTCKTVWPLLYYWLPYNRVNKRMCLSGILVRPYALINMICAYLTSPPTPPPPPTLFSHAHYFAAGPSWELVFSSPCMALYDKLLIRWGNVQL